MRSLNLSKISNRIAETISTENALKNTIPLDLPKEVAEGRHKININDATFDTKTANVGVSIKYV